MDGTSLSRQALAAKARCLASGALCATARPGALPSRGGVLWWGMQEPKGGKMNTFTFYADAATGAPVQLHMLGYNYIQYSHYDE
jgi:hypothetical protein